MAGLSPNNLMNRIKQSLCLLALFTLATPQLTAQLPPPERLLGADTTFVLTVPDWSAAVSAFKQTSGAKMFDDPALKPLFDRIASDFKKILASDLPDENKEDAERMMKILRGQITVALGDPKVAMVNPDQIPLILIVDAKDRRKDLEEFTKKLFTEKEGTQVIRERVAGGELITVVTGQDAGPEKLYFARSGSMFAASPHKQNLTDLIRRKNGDLQNTLAENTTFRANQARFLREAKGYMWVNVAALVKLAKDMAPEPKADAANPFAMSFNVKTILSAVGFDGWRSLTMAIDYDSQGSDMDLFLNVPEAQRKGLFKLIETSDRTAAPPPFVSDDVAHFMRWRKSGEEFYQTLEQMLMGISPMIGASLNMMLGQAGKTKDPNFDFKRQFIGNLGDDFMVIQKSPQEFSLSALSTPPTLYLVGSGNPTVLLDALVTAYSSMGMGMMGGKAKEEEFLGKRMIAIPAGPKMGADGKIDGQQIIYVTTARGYLAVGTERPVVEDFIRGAGGNKTVNGVSGFRAAVEKAGGTGTGWFTYDNPSDTLKVFVDALKKDPDALKNLFGAGLFNAITTQPGGAKSNGKKSPFDMEKTIADYVKLLPEFEQLQKYITFSVGTVKSDADGILVRGYTPDRTNR